MVRRVLRLPLRLAGQRRLGVEPPRDPADVRPQLVVLGLEAEGLGVELQRAGRVTLVLPLAAAVQQLLHLRATIVRDEHRNA